MRLRRLICVCAALFAALWWTAAPGGPAAQRGDAAAALARIQAMAKLPPAASREDLKAALNEQAPKVLEAVRQLEQKYPRAKEVHDARMLAIAMTARLARVNEDPKLAAEAERMAKVVVASDAPTELKLFAEAHVLVLKLKPAGGKPPARTTPRPAEPGAASATKAENEKALKGFVRRYAKTDQAVQALTVGMQLAEMMGNSPLREQFEKTLLSDHANDPMARRILRRLGKSPDVGKPFKAALTKLDGKKLALPDDLKGKAVVIDFWATWCGPCVQEIPRMKALYATYKPRGVEFVGISLDKDKTHLEEFVRKNRMGWIHTYSGKGWQDPTVQKYGIGGIPSIWVVGRDGNVVSDRARGNLAETIERALKAPTQLPKKDKPAGK